MGSLIKKGETIKPSPVQGGKGLNTKGEVSRKRRKNLNGGLWPSGSTGGW